MYLRNAWYVAAWPREVTDKPLARTICDEPVVLFRTANGAPVALRDMCCHRALQLSLGRVIGNTIQCGYHGYSFDATGACVDIPGQPNIPARARVPSFPVVEKWSCVWIWMGDAAAADPEKIPNIWWADHPDWKLSTPDMAPLNCDYRLITDNVLDATHLTYVHPTTIGASSIVDVEPLIEHDDKKVRISRWVLDRPPPPAYAMAGDFTGNADRWAAVEYWAPAVSVNFAGCVDPGFGGPDGDIRMSPHRVELVAISLPTPSTAGSCYYFFAFARAFKHDDAKMDQFFGPGMVKVFEEDFTILESQQRMLEKYPDSHRISTIYDRGPTIARQMLDRMIEVERGASKATE
jgi:phenylpropionate dioxygenase-like ring-hydroxylating dioxygenase large terminal subunit